MSAVTERSPRSARARNVALAVVAVVTIDQVTKSLAVAHLDRGERVEVVGSLLTFDLTTNSGGSFSLFQGSTPLLAILASAASVYLVHLLRTTDDRWSLVGLTLLLCGALGNLVDRVLRAPSFLHGEVVDFIRLPRWPTFNVADIAVTFGALALIGAVLRSGRAASSDEPAAEPAPEAAS